MKNWISLLLTLLVACEVFASPSLINGKVAQKGEFPFVVSLGFCTATKIGPRHFISAGHCFFSGPGQYNPRPRLTIRAPQTLNQAEMNYSKIKATSLHPTWLDFCTGRRCTGHETGSRFDRPGKVDITLIEMEEESPGIPWIEVHDTPLAAGTEVTMAGYGCSSALGSMSDHKLRYASTRLGTPELLKHPGSLYQSTAEIAGQSYSITPGTRLDPSAPALCPGDSGGPLLVQVDGKWKIMGIAADYSFSGEYEANGSIPMTNLHTRLDDQSLHQIGKWLREAMHGNTPIYH